MKSGYGQIGFNYDGQTDSQPELPQHGPVEETVEQEPDDPFQPMPNFDIPIYIETVLKRTGECLAEL